MVSGIQAIEALPLGSGWRRTDGLSFARGLQCVPVAAVEVRSVALALPMALVPQGALGWQVMALMALEPKSNACVGLQGQWVPRYIPAWLRSHPFARLKQASGGLVLGLLSSAVVPPPAAGDLTALQGEYEPLFEADGGLSPQVLQIQSFLQQVEKGVQALSVAAAQLHAAGVMQLWVPEGAIVPPGAPWYQVNERALNALSAADFALLRASGALALAYAQLLSIGQWPVLCQLAVQQAQQEAAPLPVAPVAQPMTPPPQSFVDPSALVFLDSLARSATEDTY